MVARFFGGGNALSGVIGVVSPSLVLYNDLAFQRKAAAKKKQCDAQTDRKQKAILEKGLAALKKNIRNEELRETVWRESPVAPSAETARAAASRPLRSADEPPTYEQQRTDADLRACSIRFAIS